MTMILEAKMISKHYGQLIAVDEVSFSIQQGEIFSLLGPNGAGKTTTISMLSGLLRPSDGDAFIAGHSIRQETVGQDLLAEPPVRVETTVGEEVSLDIATGAQQSSAGQLVTWTLITMLAASEVFVNERLGTHSKSVKHSYQALHNLVRQGHQSL